MVNKERREENGERKKLEKEEWTIQYEDKRMENEECMEHINMRLSATL